MDIMMVDLTIEMVSAFPLPFGTYSGTINTYGFKKRQKVFDANLPGARLLK